MDALKAFLVEKFGLPGDADKAAVTKMAAEKIASGELSHEKYLELLATKAAPVVADPFARLADVIGGAVEKALDARMPKQPAQPAANAGANGNSVLPKVDQDLVAKATAELESNAAQIRAKYFGQNPL